MDKNHYEPEITIFEDLTNPNGRPLFTNIREVINQIKGENNSQKDIILKIRSLENKDEIIILKKKLRCLMFNGKFNTKTEGGILDHSGLCIFDFDKYPSQEELIKERFRIQNDPFTYACFLSPSGKGLKVLIKIPKSNKEEHKRRFHAYKEYINSDFFDVSNSNLSRVCFNSYDPQIYWNASSDLFKSIQVEKIKSPLILSQKITVDSDDEKINKILKFPNLGEFREGYRNQYVFKLSCIFCEYGISKITAENYFSQYVQTGFDLEEIIQTINSGYLHSGSNPRKEFNALRYENTNNTGLPKITETTIITETTGNQVILIINDKTDSKEVLEGIELNSGSQKSIFIQDHEGEITTGFDYKLGLIFEKYQSTENVKDLDLFLGELISICAGLSPIQNDQYLKKLEDLESLKEMGIQRETLINAIDQARSTKEKANFKESSLRLSEKFKSDLINMDTDSAIQLHEEGLEEVRGKGKETTFARLLDVTNEEDLRSKEANLPESLDSGLMLYEEPIEFPSGAISVFCGATGHGKTILLMNSIINTADTYPDKKFVFFSYEERDTIITQYILNIYANIDLNEAKNNRKILKRYFKGGSLDFVSFEKSKEFIKKKSEFFKTYIETGRILIKYIDFDTRELCSGIHYIKRIDPSIGGVFIDYLQLLTIRGNKKQRNEEVKDICNLLLKTAIASGLPLILAAQFNREVINLNTLHTTRIAEAADIERYSSLIIGIWSLEKRTIFKGASGSEKSAIYSKLVERGLSQLERNDKKIIVTGVNLEDPSPYMYLEILKSRDMGSGGFDFYNYNSNTSKIQNIVKKKSVKSTSKKEKNIIF